MHESNLDASYIKVFSKDVCREVKDINEFLTLSKRGNGAVYQLHRDLGVAFIDLAFKIEQQHYWHRIEVVTPNYVSSNVEWDAEGFPYEREVYNISVGTIQKQVEADLYRDADFYNSSYKSLKFFLGRVVDKLQQSTHIPQHVETKLSIGKEFVERLMFVASSMVDCFDAIPSDLQEAATAVTSIDVEELASFENSKTLLLDIMAEYLSLYIKDRHEAYARQKEIADKERKQIFNDLEHEIVDSYKLTDYGFKRGFLTIVM